MDRLKKYLIDNAGASHEVTRKGAYIRIDSFLVGVLIDNFIGNVQGDVSQLLGGLLK